MCFCTEESKGLTYPKLRIHSALMTDDEIDSTFSSSSFLLLLLLLLFLSAVSSNGCPVMSCAVLCGTVLCCAVLIYSVALVPGPSN